ncbi:MAG: hypothetical protein AAF799_18530 [Myxococcota bacterium]
MSAAADPFAPLEPGEYVLLRGGYGGFAKYIWSVIFGGFAIFSVLTPIGILIFGTLTTQDWVPSLVLGPLMALIAAVPWLRSGAYRLTNRRLSFKPSLRAVREARLSEITALEDVGDRKQGLRVLTADQKLDLRNVSKWQRLWGAILLYRIEGMDEPLPPAKGRVSHVRMRCFHQTGRGRFGRGTLVLRPTYGVFLPDGSEVNALREGIAALVSSTTTIHAQLPTMEYVGRLAIAGDDIFDDRLRALARRIDATALTPGQLPGLVRPVRLWKARTMVRLREGFVMMQGSCPTAMAEAAPWLDTWGRPPG